MIQMLKSAMTSESAVGGNSKILVSKNWRRQKHAMMSLMCEKNAKKKPLDVFFVPMDKNWIKVVGIKNRQAVWDSFW